MAIDPIGFDLYLDSADDNHVVVTFWSDDVESIIKVVTRKTPAGLRECGNRRIASIPLTANLVSQYRVGSNDNNP